MSKLTQKFDKLYFELLKECTKRNAEQIMNMISKTSLIGVICGNLKHECLRVVEVLYKAALRIGFFREYLKNHVSFVIMAAINSEKGFRLAMEIEEACQPIPNSAKLNDQMLVCIHKHGLKFPSNKDLCHNYLSVYKIENMIEEKPVIFFNDDVNLMSQYLTRDSEIERLVINFCVMFGCSRIMDKAITYYKLNPQIYMKLSVPQYERKLIENSKLFNFNDPFFRFSLVNEVTTESRWDFLPLLFERVDFLSLDLDFFRIGLFSGYFDLPFVQTLIYYLEKYKIPTTILTFGQKRKIICEKEIMVELALHGLGEFYEFENDPNLIGDIIKTHIGHAISDLFGLFRSKQFDELTERLFVAHVHFNTRFIEERNAAHKLMESGDLGWSTSLKTSYNLFCIFTDRIIEQLSSMETAIMEYNSFLAVRSECSCMLKLRYMNSILHTVRNVTSRVIIDKYHRILQDVYEIRGYVMEDVRDRIGIDLPYNQEWKLPENPTLEDSFKYLYQYSRLQSHTDLALDDSFTMVKELRNRKCYKIAEEVEAAAAAFIHPSEIRTILSNKGIFV